MFMLDSYTMPSTLVDLPGLIHSANKSQSNADVELIKSIVQDYISNERTIILAVVSAKNDYANQVILERCRNIDPKGSRTLGIITKPDFLRAGSENEKTWLDLAQNKDIYFELGWHILKNRSDDERNLSFTERNLKEAVFFDTGNYKQLPPHMVGVGMLRVRLSKLLYTHLKRELPSLKVELDSMMVSTSNELSLMGTKRASVADQKLFLMKICMDAHVIMYAAVRGTYDSQFFGYVDSKAPVDDSKNIRRLRAVVQHLNIEFSRTMRQRGRKYAWPQVTDAETDGGLGEKKDSSNGQEGDDKLDASCDAQDCSDTIFHEAPMQLNRADAVEWVKRLLERSRGNELVGVFNPQLIGQLFREQSEKWEAIATAHINRLAQTCRDFVLLTLDNVTTEDVKANLLSLTIDQACKNAHSEALQELQRILNDKERPPSTYNHYFTMTLQKMQRDKYGKQLTEATNAAKVTAYTQTNMKVLSNTYLNPDVFRSTMDKSVELDMDKYSAEQALDVQAAFYKDESKYFVDVVTKQVIERHLVAPLAEILSPMVMAQLSDEEVSYIAAEPEEITSRREHLEGQKGMLEKGQEAFRLAMGKLR